MYLKRTSPLLFYFTKKLQKAKIKASKGKKISNADADADVNTDVDAAMPMPRFPNGPFVFMLK